MNTRWEYSFAIQQKVVHHLVTMLSHGRHFLRKLNMAYTLKQHQMMNYEQLQPRALALGSNLHRRPETRTQHGFIISSKKQILAPASYKYKSRGAWFNTTNDALVSNKWCPCSIPYILPLLTNTHAGCAKWLRHVIIHNNPILSPLLSQASRAWRY